MVAEDGLRLGRVQEVHERLGGIGRITREGRRDRVLDEQGVVRHDVVERLALLLGEDGLVLVGDEDVTLAGLRNVFSASRAPRSQTSTWLASWWRYSMASSSVLPASICAW